MLMQQYSGTVTGLRIQNEEVLVCIDHETGSFEIPWENGGVHDIPSIGEQVLVTFEKLPGSNTNNVVPDPTKGVCGKVREQVSKKEYAPEHACVCDRLKGHEKFKSIGGPHWCVTCGDIWG